MTLRTRGLGCVLVLACRHPSGPPPVFHFTPHTEDFRAGPVGTGLNRCELYVYPWANNGRCVVQLNHCALEREGSQRVLCLSLADERTVSCGETIDACGQRAQCDCPPGAAPPVPEPPGMMHLSPTRLGEVVRGTQAGCEARTTQLPGVNGPPPSPCILAVRECDAAGACGERTVMLSCSVRDQVCGRPVRCDCP